MASVIVAGDFRVMTQEISGAPVRVAVRGALEIDDQTLMDNLAHVIEANLEYWDASGEPYLVTVLPLEAEHAATRHVAAVGRPAPPGGRGGASAAPATPRTASSLAAAPDRVHRAGPVEAAMSRFMQGKFGLLPNREESMYMQALARADEEHRRRMQGGSAVESEFDSVSEEESEDEGESEEESEDKSEEQSEGDNY